MKYPSRATALVAPIAALALTLALTGCGAGQVSETAKQRSVVDGAAATIDKIALRNVGINASTKVGGYVAGDSAKLTLAIANSGQEDDELISVTTDGATSVQIYSLISDYASTTAGATAAPSASATPSPSTSAPVSATATGGTAGATVTPTGNQNNGGSTQSATGSVSSGSVSSGSASSASGSSAATAPAPTTVSASVSTSAASKTISSVQIPALRAVTFAIGDSTGPLLVLVGLKGAIGGGQTIPITFTFAKAGAVTINVPVRLSVGAADEAPSVTFSPTE